MSINISEYLNNQIKEYIFNNKDNNVEIEIILSSEKISIENYLDETGLSEAVVKSLESGMLASGFDLKQTKAGGAIIVGSKASLQQIPANNINYMYYNVNIYYLYILQYRNHQIPLHPEDLELSEMG